MKTHVLMWKMQFPQEKSTYSPKGGDTPAEGRGRAHHFCDLGNVLSVLPAGKHISERQGLQARVDQVRFRWRLLDIFSCGYTEVSVSRPRPGDPVFL